MPLILYLTPCTNQPAPEILRHNPEVLAFTNKNLISSASKQSDKSPGLINSVLQWRSPKGEKKKKTTNSCESMRG